MIIIGFFIIFLYPRVAFPVNVTIKYPMSSYGTNKKERNNNIFLSYLLGQSYCVIRDDELHCEHKYTVEGSNKKAQTW